MTASDLNNSMQYIDDKYLNIVDAYEKKIPQKSACKILKMIIFILMIVCLIIGGGIASFAHEKQIIRWVFGF